MDIERIRELEKLAELLVDSDKPEVEIKFQMEKVGLDYTEDRMDRLNQILMALHPVQREERSPSRELQ